MANKKPVTLTETIHIRCDAEFVAMLDDMRSQDRPLVSRSDLLRKLAYAEKARRDAAKQNT